MDIFILGSKGIPSNYGGFETFVEKLTEKKVSTEIKYHVACMSDSYNEFFHNNARCFNVAVPNIGSAKAVLYDVLSLKECYSYIKRNKLTNCTIYILACRIGPFLSYYKWKLNQLGVRIYVNPDGHEWKRSKWNKAIRWYWKYSEKLMIKNADIIICDSKGIQNYIQREYAHFHPVTDFIAYGADLERSKILDPLILQDWIRKNKISKNGYYLVVGRFVPENNYETMISEFMRSTSNKDLVIISNVESNDFYNELLLKTNFKQDNRIKFVGTVYNQELLKKIRENAFAYFHGHEVGGTNPSLLEALASTRLNLLLDVVFNREVGENGALYFSKEKDNLAKLIASSEQMDETDIEKLQALAYQRIAENYTWEYIIGQYEQLFETIAAVSKSNPSSNQTKGAIEV
ncbi:beta 1-4 rhamnosyltransferase Cps2T [Paenibacillus solisilvae]|uniref:Beta 1-4 rhamnosyltransferase Cps2T n=1 Tax=Paenibacillus solisilvae TaxID=2486751 RepID=A0ABW0VVE7_9BACL